MSDEASVTADEEEAPSPDLATELARWSIDLPAEQVAALDRYREALWKINETLNLTRHTTYEKFVTRDVCDSLAVATLLDEGEKILDVGTGGGVPGAIIAIVRPDVRVTMCDSVAKKAHAVTDICEAAGIKARVRHGRAEMILKNANYDTLVLRAVASLSKTLTLFAPNWNAFQRMLLVKGKLWVAERHEARQAGQLNKLHLRRAAIYATPGAEIENVVLQVSKKEEYQ